MPGEALTELRRICFGGPSKLQALERRGSLPGITPRGAAHELIPTALGRRAFSRNTTLVE